MLQDMISKTVVMDAAEQFKHVLPCTEENIQLMKKPLFYTDRIPSIGSSR